MLDLNSVAPEAVISGAFPARDVSNFAERMRAAKETKRAKQERFPDEGEAVEPSQDQEEPSEALGGDEFPLPVPVATPGKAPNQMRVIREAFLRNQGMTPKELAKMLAEQGYDFKLSSIAAVITDARSVLSIARELGMLKA